MYTVAACLLLGINNPLACGHRQTDEDIAVIQSAAEHSSLTAKDD
jgi:hypothetical protein